MKPTLRRRAFGAALMLCISAAHAQPLQWTATKVHISVESRDLKDVLRDFAASQGIVATISPNVQGTVSGRFDLPPRRFIDTLAATFGFVWFYDGNVMSVSTADDVSTKVIQLDFAGTQKLRTTLKAIGIELDRFPVVYDPEDGVALVTGPSRLTSLVTQIASRIDQNANRRMGTEVRAFPLKYGWAADHQVSINGATTTVPGIAHVLSTLYHPGQGIDGKINSPTAPGGNALLRSVAPLAGANGSAEGTSVPLGNNSVNAPFPSTFGTAASVFAGTPVSIPSAGDNGGDPSVLDGRGSGTQPDIAGGLPVIEADARTNTILIRDLPDRVDQYQDVIDHLDVKRRMVEIEAHIISIDDGALKQLGINWHAHSSHIDLQTGDGVASANNYTGQANQTFTSTDANGNTTTGVTPTGLALTSVIGNAGRYLLAQVDALETSNQAREDASPKVATLDDVEAVMDNKTNFFVPVNSYTSGNLYSVSVGNTLRVLPMVIDEGGKVQIKLQVHVEDGSLSGTSVQNIPETTTSEIDTEAVVNEGQSLLIAGYRVDDDTHTETGIPVLSKIPLLGALFRTRGHNRSHQDRLVLLSPRVIDY